MAVPKHIQEARQRKLLKKSNPNKLSVVPALIDNPAEYKTFLAALLDRKRSKMESGKFIDLGVSKTPAVKMGSPEERALTIIAFTGQPADKNGWAPTIDGLCLLVVEVQKLPEMKNPHFVANVLRATGQQIPDELRAADGPLPDKHGIVPAGWWRASETIAEGLRDLFLSQGGVCRVSTNWKVA